MSTYQNIIRDQAKSTRFWTNLMAICLLPIPWNVQIYIKCVFFAVESAQIHQNNWVCCIKLWNCQQKASERCRFILKSLHFKLFLVIQMNNFVLKTGLISHKIHVRCSFKDQWLSISEWKTSKCVGNGGKGATHTQCSFHKPKCTIFTAKHPSQMTDILAFQFQIILTFW